MPLLMAILWEQVVVGLVVTKPLMGTQLNVMAVEEE